MIIDRLENAARYFPLSKGIRKGLEYLIHENLTATLKGRYPIESDQLFAIVNEYDSIDPAGEQMESHRKYIDIQLIVSGEELIGHAILEQQEVSKPYNESEDYMLYADPPAFYSKLSKGMFAILFPEDLHMPNLRVSEAIPVKKVVVKVAVDY